MFGDGAVIVTQLAVVGADRSGARIIHPPADHPYGERQYPAEDPGGHRWTFSESLADVDPADWGGTLIAE